jgi:hypothetical protein
LVEIDENNFKGLNGSKKDSINNELEYNPGKTMKFFNDNYKG